MSIGAPTYAGGPATGAEYDLPAADEPVYVISVAAAIAGLHPQTLRQYDRLGLVSPARSIGRNRLYSARDIRRIHRIQRLSDDGVNLAGITRILQLEVEVTRLRDRLEEVAKRERSRALVIWRPDRRRRV